MRKANGTITPSAPLVRSVLTALFFDMARKIPIYSHSSDDCHYILCRIDKEGDSFAFMTLPLLGKAIERSLIQEEPFKAPLGWHFKKNTKLPLFLYELFSYLYTDDAQPKWGKNPLPMMRDVVFFLRQVCSVFSKVEYEAARSKCLETVNGFKERTTRSWEPDGSSRELSEILRLAREILARVFEGDSPCLSELRGFQKEPWGRHGPGAVAGSECGSEKWDHNWWPGLSDKLFVFSPGYAVFGGFPLDSQPIARVVTVPKDFRGPRVICIEPKENQFAQQGIMDILYRHLHECPLTRDSIDFLNVEENQRLCYDNNFVTIDLKDASDNVSLRLARLLLPQWVFALVTRYRTRLVSYEGDVWRTTCLASMGNATCFPLETLIFWAIARSAMNRVKLSFPPQARKSLVGTLRVFGDDIIVPKWAGDCVIDALGLCGSQVNPEKTCLGDLVRESCGEWVCAGESCRIVKMRCAHVKDHRSWLQLQDNIVQFRSFACFATAEALAELCSQVYPVSSFKRRVNQGLQRLEFRVPRFVTKGHRSRLTDYAALYAWYVSNDVIPFSRGTRKLVKWGWVEKRDLPASFAGVLAP